MTAIIMIFIIPGRRESAPASRAPRVNNTLVPRRPRSSSGARGSRDPAGAGVATRAAARAGVGFRRTRPPGERGMVIY